MKLTPAEALELKAGDIILLFTEGNGPGERKFYADRLSLTDKEFDVFRDNVLKVECTVKYVERKPHNTFIYVVRTGLNYAKPVPIPYEYFTRENARTESTNQQKN